MMKLPAFESLNNKIASIDWEFPFYKKIIWKLFGKKTVGVDIADGFTTTTTAYTLFHITYVDKVEQS